MISACTFTIELSASGFCLTRTLYTGTLMFFGRDNKHMVIVSATIRVTSGFSPRIVKPLSLINLVNFAKVITIIRLIKDVVCVEFLIYLNLSYYEPKPPIL